MNEQEDDGVMASHMCSEWWKRFHSGSEALEIARRFLDGEIEPTCRDVTFDMAMVCSELIFRVTGEQLAPSRVRVNRARGIAYSSIGAELHAFDAQEAA
jgi:hypothetical protein